MNELVKTNRLSQKVAYNNFFHLIRDPDTIARQQQQAKKEKMDKDDEERMMEFIEKQVGGRLLMKSCKNYFNILIVTKHLLGRTSCQRCQE